MNPSNIVSNNSKNRSFQNLAVAVNATTTTVLATWLLQNMYDALEVMSELSGSAANWGGGSFEYQLCENGPWKTLADATMLATWAAGDHTTYDNVFTRNSGNILNTTSGQAIATKSVEFKVYGFYAVRLKAGTASGTSSVNLYGSASTVG